MKIVVRNSKKQVIEVEQVRVGDTVLSGSLRDNQRKFMMATGEEIRLHAANGGYLFSVRNGSNGPTIFHDILFSQQSNEFEQSVELYPWLKK